MSSITIVRNQKSLMFSNYKKANMQRSKSLRNLSILEKLFRESKMERESCTTQMAEFMKDNGKIILNKVKAMNNSIMGQFIKGPMLKGNLKDMAGIHGIMEKPMKANGSTE